jgi:hypothetical protein
MRKAATSALGAGDLEWLNSAAQSGYASGSLVVAANRGGASTARSGGPLRCVRADHDQCVYLPDTAYEARL